MWCSCSGRQAEFAVSYVIRYVSTRERVWWQMAIHNGGGDGESTKDALYSFENVPLRPANLSNAREIGNQPNLEIRWAIDEHFLAALNLAGFLTRTFLQQSPPSKDIVFVNVGLTYRF